MLQVSTSSVDKTFRSAATCFAVHHGNTLVQQHSWFLLAKGIAIIRRLRSTLINSPPGLGRSSLRQMMGVFVYFLMLLAADSEIKNQCRKKTNWLPA
jgi:hypothetical protein